MTGTKRPTCNHCGKARGHLPGCRKGNPMGDEQTRAAADAERVVRLRAKARRLARQGRTDDAESYFVQADSVEARAELEATVAGEAK